jgi:hypothetical protein
MYLGKVYWKIRNSVEGYKKQNTHGMRRCVEANVITEESLVFQNYDQDTVPPSKNRNVKISSVSSFYSKKAKYNIIFLRDASCTSGVSRLQYFAVP